MKESRARYFCVIAFICILVLLRLVLVADGISSNPLLKRPMVDSALHHDLAVKIAGNSSQLSSGLDKGGLKEVSVAADNGYIVILGDVKVVLAGIAGEGARESMGLLRMALKRALMAMVS